LKKSKFTKVVTIVTFVATIITFISVVVSFLIPLCLSYKYHPDSSKVTSIGVIGGADGPTAIFVTNQLYPYLITFIFALISMVGIVYLILAKKATK
jgi:Na+-transporting methylmalonyl-CoA/oxaloacetate decarboxylase beta subunit